MSCPTSSGLNHSHLLVIFFNVLAGESACNLEDVLVFMTGADRIPILGFELPPKLSFLEYLPSKLLPTASTCSVELRLPTIHTDYSVFKEHMVMALKGHDGFGGV